MTSSAPRARVDDWDAALDRVIAAHQQQPFAWGTSDCLHFALDVAAALTGFDPRAADPPVYNSRNEAMTVLRERGFDTIEQMLNHYFLKIHPAWAHRGDIAVINQDDGISVGVFVGAMIAVKDIAGLGFVPRSRAVMAFRI
jgi:hypothetical protein